MGKKAKLGGKWSPAKSKELKQFINNIWTKDLGIQKKYLEGSPGIYGIPL